MGSEAMSFASAKQTGPKMGSEAMRPPPVPPRRWAEAAKELKAEMHAAAVVHGAEMHAAAVARGEAEPAAGPPKRGARPDRPSQKAREAGRSWERMAEKLSDVKVELAMKSAEVVELQGRMAEMEMEQGQKVKLLTEQISQLEATNFQPACQTWAKAGSTSSSTSRPRQAGPSSRGDWRKIRRTTCSSCRLCWRRSRPRRRSGVLSW